MKKKILFLVGMLFFQGNVFSAESTTREQLDAQMIAAKTQLDELNKQKTVELRKQADAEESFKGRQSHFTGEDIGAIRMLTAQSVRQLDSKIAETKERIKELGGQIKALKSSSQSAPRVAGAESESRAVASVEPLVQEFQPTISPSRETRLQELTRTSREKMIWITANKARITAELDELKVLTDRYRANAGILPKDSLARLHALQISESKNIKGLKDLAGHEEGLIAFLTEKGLLHVLSDSPRVSPKKHQLDDEAQEDQQEDAPKGSKRVQWRPSLVHAAEIPNNDGQGGVNLQDAAQDHDSVSVVGRRRNTRVGAELPSMDDRGVITFQRGLVTVHSAPDDENE